MAPAGFESMPTDLILMVLSQLSSPKDVYSTIRASALCYRTFMAKKSLVLAAAIHQAIPSEILPEAIAACAASEISNPASRCDDWESAKKAGPRTSRKLAFDALRRERVAAHLAHSTRHITETNLRDLAVTVPLCRLWAIVDFFVSDFASKASAKIQSFVRARGSSSSYASGPEPCHMQSLSRTERLRLQRVFFRFETYRRLFGGLDQVWLNMWPDRPSGEHLSFVKRFSPWEREELTSIYEYLVTFVENVFDDLKTDEFINIQEAAKEEEAGLGERSNIKVGGLAGLELFKRIEESGQPDLVCFLVELGLPFLRRLSSMTKLDRMAIAASFAWSECQTLDTLLTEVWNPSKDIDRQLTFSGESLHEASAGWIRKCATRSHYEQFDDYGLRELGYVFWDKLRLETTGLLDLFRQDLGALPNPRDEIDSSPDEDPERRWVAFKRLKPRDYDPTERREWLDSMEY